MKHFVLANSDDRSLWGIPESCAALAIESSARVIAINPETADLNWHSVHVVVCMPSSVGIDNVDFWNPVLTDFPDDAAFWWHIGGNDSKNFRPQTIKEKWQAQATGALAVLKEKLLPLPYSMNSGENATDWDKVFGDLSVQCAAIDLQQTSRGAMILALFEALDKEARKAEAFYFGFQPLKALLAELLPIYLDLKTLRETTDKSKGTGIWKRAKEDLAKLENSSIGHREKCCWLNTMFDRFIKPGQGGAALNVPTKEEAQGALDYLLELRNLNLAPKRMTLERLDDIKLLFQILNAQPNFN